MKYIKKTLLILMVLFGTAAILTGCVGGSSAPKQLNTPVASVMLNNGRLMLMTTDNPNAESYVFGIYTGNSSSNYDLYFEQTATTHFLDVTQYVTQSAQYYFYVQAVGNGTRYLTSNRSAVVTYDNSQALTAPTLEITGNTLSWTAILDSNGYKVFKNNVLLTTTQNTTYSIAGQINSPIIYTFEVQAVGKTVGGITYKDSLKSNQIIYTAHLNLQVPKNVRIELNQVTNSSYLTWDTVSNASGYTVLIDNTQTQIVTTNQFNLSTLNLPKQYTLQVKANASGVLIESAYSNAVSYNNYVALEKPQIIGASRNGSDVLVVWDEVTSAQTYTLYVNGETLKDVNQNVMVIYDAQVLIPGSLEKPEGGFDLEVKANAYGFYLESEVSELFSYAGIDLLEAPQNIEATKESDVVTVTWDAVAGASYYVVAIDNEGFSTTELSMDITELLTLDQIVQIRVQAKGQGFVVDSEFSEPVFFNNIEEEVVTANKNYTGSYYYYYGYHDFYITSQEEMNTFFAYLISSHIADGDSASRNLAYINYALTAREEKIADGYIFEVATNLQINTIDDTLSILAGDEMILTYLDGIVYELEWNEELYQISLEEKNRILAFTTQVTELYHGNLGGTLSTQEAIAYKQSVALLSYTETHNLGYYPPNAVGSSVNEYKFRLTFNYSVNPSLTSPQTNYTQNSALSPFESATGRASDYNGFIVEESLIEIEVNSTDELLMVVSSGAKPIFTDEESQAAQVYNAAKIVLCQIIDDNMTDFEKMLAIFDYVSYNTVYDHYVLNLVVNGQSSGVQNYKVFYIEGVILDGKAVCDGIAKTVALLANMEGIKTVKVNGVANGGSGLVGHAWNKVYLEIDGVSNWYVMDATWSDITSGTEEYLSHRYFLLTDADIEDTHFAASEFNPVANTVFNYYDYFEYELGYDYYIENQTELNHIFDYFIDNNAPMLEIRVAQGFTPDFGEALQYGVSSSYMKDGAIYSIGFNY